MSFALHFPDGFLSHVENRMRQVIREELQETQQPARSWMNAKSAADYLDTTEDALRSLVKRHAISVHRAANGTLRFRQEELDAYARGEHGG